VHLGDRGAGHRLVLEGSRRRRQRPAERALDGGDRHLDGNGGTRSCSSASSSAMSAGSRSRRVDSTWPNLTKMGPRCSSAWRRRWPRGASSCAERRWCRAGPATQAEAGERQLVQPVAQDHPEDEGGADVPRHPPACPGRPGAPGPGCRPRARPCLADELRRLRPCRRMAWPMAWAGASPTTRDRSSSRSQRTWSTSHCTSAASCTSPAMRTGGLSPRRPAAPATRAIRR
jgi:hypothetical protein